MSNVGATKILPESHRSFAVFVDTNTIFTNIEEIQLFPKAFSTWWLEMAKSSDVQLIIPHLVFSELHQQKTKHYWSLYSTGLSAIRKVEGKIAGAKISSETLSFENIKEYIDKVLFDQLKNTPRCGLEITPYREITADGIKAIVENAIWRKPPFKENKEGEGFRDAIILETLRVFRADNPHVDVVFLSKDKVLFNAAEMLSKIENNVIVFQDLDSAASYINFARMKFDPEFLNMAISKATAILQDFDSSILGADIRRLMLNARSLNQGEKHFETTSGSIFPSTFISEGDPSFVAADTKFLSVVGDDMFHWESSIGIFCNYMESFVPALLGSVRAPERKVRIILVQLEWESKVNSDGDFTDFKILNYKFSTDYMRKYDEFYSPDTLENGM